MNIILRKSVGIFYRVPRNYLGKLRRLARRKIPWERFRRFLYRSLPSPKIWAFLARTRVPDSWLTGKESRLIRPESISFSTCGSELAVCNSTGSSVTIYPSLDDGRYGAAPTCVITNAKYLNYIHDAIITPSDKYLIAVARDVHTLSLFDRQKNQNRKQDDEPLWTLVGEKSKLSWPTSVAIHPTESCIAVANRKSYGITTYEKSPETDFFESEPLQCLQEKELSEFDLAPPHGLDFSPKGEFLFVAHKFFSIQKNPEASGQSALSIFEYQDGTQLLHPEPKAIRLYGTAKLHSVSVHPSLNLIAVSIEAQGVDLLYYSKEKGTLEIVDSFSIFRIGASIKGSGFTRDGKQVAVTSDLNEVLFFNITSSVAKLTQLTAVLKPEG